MSERDNYTDAEWATLVGAPVAVIATVIGASPGNPVGVAQEVGAAVKAFERAAEERRGNPLIAALLVTLKARFDAYVGKQSDDAAAEQVDIFALGADRERAMATIGAASELMARKAPAEQADELRAWLLELANEVAAAASEGGFLGIGGEQVSAEEHQVLGAIATALGKG